VILVTPPVVGLKRTLHDSISLSGAVIVKFTGVQSGIIFYGSETVKVGQVSRLGGGPKPGLRLEHDLHGESTEKQGLFILPNPSPGMVFRVFRKIFFTARKPGGKP
jgi:hypothetical protein